MSVFEELKGLGVDVDGGLERAMGDRSLYTMMLGMFADTVRTTTIATEEFDGGLEPLIEKVHMLKGTAGNLSLTPIFNGYNRTLELLREGQPGKARAEFEAMRPVQEKLMDCIKKSAL